MSNRDVLTFTPYGHDLSLIKDDRLTALHSYWLSIHGGTSLPSRKQLDPLCFPSGLVGYVSLFDVIDDGNGGYRVFFRIAGTFSHGHKAIIKSVNGRELHEVLTPDEARLTIQEWSIVIRTRRPIAATGVSFPFQYGPQPWEAIALPLSSGGETVDGLLTARVPIIR
jgi:hypothetical protein